ncbi:MAG TPA: protein phosphatase 2C domain-containing protein [Candidatus Elarobacter sp.]|nr:protein phosphatase 2C domain-containing protein [Candidatus Elarobacter sp.]
MTADFSVATLWQIGRRSRNEDRYGEVVSRDGTRRAWAVADGVGGHPGGDLAAEAAVAGALAHVERAESGETIGATVRHGLEAAQEAVARARSSGGRNAGMATTIVLAVSDGRTVAWGHVGDSRIYRIRDGSVERLTRDHSVAEAMRALSGASDADEALPVHGDVLLSSLGADEPAYTIGDVEELRRDDVFLLCTDGLWAHVSARTLAAELQAAVSLQDWLDRLGRHVQSADDPRQDNFTAIAFRATSS